MESLNIQNITSFLVYISNFQVLVCTSCGYALKSTSNIYNHLHKSHHNNTQELDEYNAKKSEINTLKILENPLALKLENYIYYFDFLPIINCFKCTKCVFINTAYKTLKVHLNQIHKIKSNTNNASFYTSYIKPVKCQTLFNIKQDISYFIIKDPSNTLPNLNQTFNINPNSLISSLKELDNPTNLVANIDPKELDNFLYNTYFISFLDENRDLVQLSSYIKPLSTIDDNKNYNIFNILEISITNLLANNQDIISNIQPFYL
jgi:hypothetical protein